MVTSIENLDVDAVSSARLRAALRFAGELTRAPAGITRQRVEDLRKEGFDDHDVLDIVQVTAFFNYVNRLAEGLGISSDD